MKKKMKKYTFRFHSDAWVDVTVAAEDLETARMLADNRYGACAREPTALAVG